MVPGERGSVQSATFGRLPWRAGSPAASARPAAMSDDTRRAEGVVRPRHPRRLTPRPSSGRRSPRIRTPLDVQRREPSLRASASGTIQKSTRFTAQRPSNRDGPNTRPPDDDVLSHPTHGGTHVPPGRLGRTPSLRSVDGVAEALCRIACSLRSPARRPHPLDAVPPRPHARPAHRQGDARRGRRVPARRGRCTSPRPPDRRAAGGAARRPADPLPEPGARPGPRRRGARRRRGRRARGPLRRADVVEPRRRRRRLDRRRQGAAAGPAPVRGADQRDAAAGGRRVRDARARPRRGGRPRRRWSASR